MRHWGAMLVILMGSNALAQSAEMRAKFAYDEAMRQLKAGAFTECVKHLETARTSLGRPALKLQGPLVECNFKAGWYDATIREARTYFELNPDQSLQEFHDVGAMLIRAEDALKAQTQKAAADAAAQADRRAAISLTFQARQGLVFNWYNHNGWLIEHEASVSIVEPCVVEVYSEEQHINENVSSSDRTDDDIFRKSFRIKVPLRSNTLQFIPDNFPDYERRHAIFIQDPGLEITEYIGHIDDRWVWEPRRVQAVAFYADRRDQREQLLALLNELRTYCRAG